MKTKQRTLPVSTLGEMAKGKHGGTTVSLGHVYFQHLISMESDVYITTPDDDITYVDITSDDMLKGLMLKVLSKANKHSEFELWRTSPFEGSWCIYNSDGVKHLLFKGVPYKDMTECRYITKDTRANILLSLIHKRSGTRLISPLEYELMMKQTRKDIAV